MRPMKPEEREKWLEKHLTKRVKETGGLSLKYSNPIATGYPDRMIMYPNGVLMWAEIKTFGKKPTALQTHRLKQLQGLGFHTWVCDNLSVIEEIVQTGQRLSEIQRRRRNSGLCRTPTSAEPSDG